MTKSAFEILSVFLIISGTAVSDDAFDTPEYTLSNRTKVFKFGKKHVEPQKKLSCFTCNSIKDEDNCYTVVNDTTPLQTCNSEHETYCKVRRVEYTQTEANDRTIVPWSMERGCASECSNFCVNMGARTKITYCTSCCDFDGCNIDNEGHPLKATLRTIIIVLVGIVLLSNGLFYIDLCMMLYKLIAKD